jgi:hypothetical protein
MSQEWMYVMSYISACQKGPDLDGCVSCATTFQASSMDNAFDIIWVRFSFRTYCQSWESLRFVCKVKIASCFLISALDSDGRC